MLSIMKAFTGLGGFLILVIALAMLGVIIWSYLQASYLFISTTYLGIILGFDLLVIFASVIGICGIKRQSGPMLCIFQIFVMIFFFAFVSIGIMSITLPTQIFQGDCNSPTNQIAQKIHNVSLVSKYLCSPLCPCGLTDQAIKSQSYAPLEQEKLTNSTSRIPNGPLKFQDCTNFSIPAEQIFSILGAAQLTLECSGWCPNQNSLIYTFTDVNRGKPQITCYESMKPKIQQFGNVVGIAAFISAVFMLLVSICGLCICCAPDRRSQPMASRFIVNDGGNYRPV